MENQREIVMRHLKEVGSITPIEALQEYGIFRLASRVCELRKMGANIQDETVYYTNRLGKKKHYSKYFLANDEK